jgi:hypothetical protein
MDEACCHKFLLHLQGRMHTTDIIVEEVENRASRSIGPDGVRMKAAADCAQRRLIVPGKVQVDVLTAEDSNSYDRHMQQLRQLAQARKATFDGADIVERHAGEASAMVLCERKRAAGIKIIFLTNDGDASTIAARQGFEVIHFGHALHELVCAKLLTNDLEWGFYQRAVGMSGIPKAATLRAASDLVCSGVPGDCPACAQQS